MPILQEPSFYSSLGFSLTFASLYVFTCFIFYNMIKNYFSFILNHSLIVFLDETEKNVIRSALQYWESYTCITFEEIKYKDNASINANQVYIVFTSNEG